MNELDFLFLMDISDYSWEVAVDNHWADVYWKVQHPGWKSHWE